MTLRSARPGGRAFHEPMDLSELTGAEESAESSRRMRMYLSPESAPPQNLTRAEKDNILWHYNDSSFALKREHSFLSISHSL